MTTGGDCSGLNTVIQRIMRGAQMRHWRVIGIMDGTDGLCATPPQTIELTNSVLPIENARLAGSFLHNGHAGVMNFETAAANGTTEIKTGRIDFGRWQRQFFACLGQSRDIRRSAIDMHSKNN